jgi:hypothetical protein
MLDDPLVNAKTVGQKENLGMKGPPFHIPVKVDQVWVVSLWLKKWLPAKPLT